MDKSIRRHAVPSAHRVPMTVDEANRIEEQVERGVIDPNIPGTMSVVNEAHRTGVRAYMWGSAAGTPARSRKRTLIAATCGVAALTIAGLVLSFLASR
jgi:hypothetical protein